MKELLLKSVCVYRRHHKNNSSFRLTVYKLTDYRHLFVLYRRQCVCVVGKCNRALGMQSGEILDSSITASSYLPDRGPSSARYVMYRTVGGQWLTDRTGRLFMGDWKCGPGTEYRRDWTAGMRNVGHSN